METNFQQIVKDLISVGLSEPVIATEVGCNQSTINRIKRGEITDPSYTLGEALSALHKAKFKDRAA